MAAVRFRPNEGSTRVAAITNHALIQCAATACCCLGFYAIFHNKVWPWVGRALTVLVGVGHRALHAHWRTPLGMLLSQHACISPWLSGLSTFPCQVGNLLVCPCRILKASSTSPAW